MWSQVMRVVWVVLCHYWRKVVSNSFLWFRQYLAQHHCQQSESITLTFWCTIWGSIWRCNLKLVRYYITYLIQWISWCCCQMNGDTPLIVSLHCLHTILQAKEPQASTQASGGQWRLGEIVGGCWGILHCLHCKMQREGHGKAICHRACWHVRPRWEVWSKEGASALSMPFELSKPYGISQALKKAAADSANITEVPSQKEHELLHELEKKHMCSACNKPCYVL